MTQASGTIQNAVPNSADEGAASVFPIKSVPCSIYVQGLLQEGSLATALNNAWDV